jgi:hypothetical protein
VRHFRSIFFALAAFLWLPVSAHCQLEAIPGLEFLQCDDDAKSEDGSRKDCRDAGCCAVEKAQYKSELHRVTLPSPVFLPVAFASVFDTPTILRAEVNLGIVTAAPPELPGSWQFFLRAALPVRAPSLAS